MEPPTGPCLKKVPRDAPERSAHLLPCRGGWWRRWAGSAQTPAPPGSTAPAERGRAGQRLPLRGSERSALQGSPRAVRSTRRRPRRSFLCPGPPSAAAASWLQAGRAKALPGAPAPSRGGPGRWGGTQKGGRALSEHPGVGGGGSPPGLGQVASPALSLVYRIPVEGTLLPTPSAVTYSHAIVLPDPVGSFQQPLARKERRRGSERLSNMSQRARQGEGALRIQARCFCAPHPCCRTAWLRAVSVDIKVHGKAYLVPCPPV